MTDVAGREEIALYSSFGARIGTELAGVPEDIKELELSDLEELVKPSFNHYQIKKALWDEYYKAQSKRKPKPLDHKDVVRAARVPKWTFDRMLRKPDVCWWLVIPTGDYQTKMEFLATKCLRCEEEILNTSPYQPVINKDGDIVGEKVDAKILELKAKLIKDIKDRTVGPVVKKLDVNSNQTRSEFMSPRDGSVDVTAEELDDKIEALEEKFNEAGSVLPERAPEEDKASTGDVEVID